MPTAPASPSRSAFAGREITIAVIGGRVQRESARVSLSRGDELRLTVTADVADEVHVHGYDERARVTPAAPAVLTFALDIPGVFDVELEEAGIELVELEVR